MIDWDSPDWGGQVHYAENGSWVSDKHDKHNDREKAKKRPVNGSEHPQDHEPSRRPDGAH